MPTDSNPVDSAADSPSATQIAAVLFDLDGTLLDTAPDFHAAVNRLRREEGLTEISYELIRKTVSNGAAGLISTAFDITPQAENFVNLQQRLLSYYEQDVATRTQPFDGIDELLRWLEQAKIPWGIVTNKPERFTGPLLKQLQLSSRCAATICPEHVRHRKPHPESLLLACQQIGCPPEQVVYVGDHQRDIEAGIRAGMKTVSALYGYLEEHIDPADWQASYMATTAADLQSWLMARTGPTTHQKTR